MKKTYYVFCYDKNLKSRSVLNCHNIQFLAKANLWLRKFVSEVIHKDDSKTFWITTACCGSSKKSTL